MRRLVHLVLLALAAMLCAYVLPGVSIDSFAVAVIVAILLGAINLFVRPVLLLLTLPLTIVTLGGFALVVNAALILLVSALVPGFTVAGFWWAAAFGLLLGIVNGFLQKMTPV